VIVSETHRFVFVSTPKCGTNTMYTLLPQLYKHNLQVPPLYHGRFVPDEYKGFFVFSIVRNPYARAVSLWYSTTANPDNRCYCRKVLGTTDFTVFLRHLLTRPRELVRRSLDHNQSDWLAPVRLDTVLRLETLADGLRRLPFWPADWDGNLPRLNASGGCPPWRSLMTPERIELIHRWAGHDFRRFRFRRIDPV